MDEQVFDKIKRLIGAVLRLRPNVNIGDEKEREVYLALHDLKRCAEELYGEEIDGIENDEIIL